MKKSLVILFLIIKLILAQPVQFHIKVVPDSITIGDKVSLFLTYDFADSFRVKLLPWEKKLPEYVEFFDKSLKKPKTNDSNQNQIVYHIALFDTGKINLPPFQFQVLKKTTDSLGFTISSDSVIIYVQSVIKDTSMAKLQPPEPPIALPFPLKKYVPVFLAIVLVLILIYWIYRKWKNKPSAKVTEQVAHKPTIPAHEIALSKLKELKERKILSPVDLQKVFTELSFILREYLENRYSFPALESTTREIKISLKKELTNPDLLVNILKILEICDLVKFAKYQSETMQLNQLLDMAIDFVQKTKEVPQQPNTMVSKTEEEAR